MLIRCHFSQGNSYQLPFKIILVLTPQERWYSFTVPWFYLYFVFIVFVFAFFSGSLDIGYFWSCSYIHVYYTFIKMTLRHIQSSSSSSHAASTDIPDPLLPLSPYYSLPLAGPQSHIPYPHIAAECMFELVVLLLPGHMWGSIGVYHLWTHPCISSSVLHVWFI